jgi:hypothetical protein
MLYLPECGLRAQPCGCQSRQRPGRRPSSSGPHVPSCTHCVTQWADLHVRAGAARRERKGGVGGRGAEPQRAPRPGRRQGRGRRSGAPPISGPASLRRICCWPRAAASPRAASTACCVAARACRGQARRRAGGGAHGGADGFTGPSWHTSHMTTGGETIPLRSRVGEGKAAGCQRGRRARTEECRGLPAPGRHRGAAGRRDRRLARGCGRRICGQRPAGARAVARTGPKRIMMRRKQPFQAAAGLHRTSCMRCSVQCHTAQRGEPGTQGGLQPGARRSARPARWWRRSCTSRWASRARSSTWPA